VHARGVRVGLHHLDAFAFEHRVEGVGERGIPIADQEPESVESDAGRPVPERLSSIGTPAVVSVS
jgi:hypothetical protein